MWHLDCLEMPQDVSKSDQFNIDFDQLTKPDLTPNTLILYHDSPDAGPTS